MAPEKIVFVSSTCPYCEDYIRRHKEEIERGEIKIINVESEEGYEELMKIKNAGMKFYEVPKCVIKYSDNKYEFCNIDEEG